MLLYLKSSISISAYSGCTINCKYCILSTARNNNHTEKIIEESQLCDVLFDYKYFKKDFTPISINNISDPFLNIDLKCSTYKILTILKKNNIKNPILLITKGYLNDIDINKISKYKLNIYVLYTYSGISSEFENRNEKKQIETIKKLSALDNITLIHYWRPIIEGVNTDNETLNKVSDLAVSFFESSILSGIRINSHLKEVFDKNAIPINIDIDKEHKVILKPTYQRILKILQSKKNNYLSFSKTSCAICNFERIKDYNGYSYKKGFCIRNCSNYSTCKNKKTTSDDEVFKLLNIVGKNLRFEILSDRIKVFGTLTQEECSFIRHNTNMLVIPTCVEKSNNEEILSE